MVLARDKILLIISFVFLGMIMGKHAQAQSSLLDTQDVKLMRRLGISSSLLLGSSITFDSEISHFFVLISSSDFSDASRFLNYFGDKRIVVAGNALLFGSSLLFDDSRLQETSWNSFESIGASAVITGLLKLSFSRARPDENRGPYHFRPVSWRNDAFKSFPSGHTTLAFAFITPYAEQYSRWLYAIPFSVALGRVYRQDHWSSDVILGASVGFFTGYFLQHKNRHITFSFNRIVVRF